MQQPKDIGVLFIAGFGPIVPDLAQSRALYGQALGISFELDINLALAGSGVDRLATAYR